MTASGHRRSGVTLRRARGLTLIELMLVTLLILALVGLSAPLFKRTLSDLAAKDASFRISKLINYAQEMAVLGRKNYKISFDFGKGSYQFLEFTGVVEKKSVYKRVSGRFGKLFGVPQGIKLSGTVREIVFYPDGHCDEGNIKVITKLGGYSLEVKRFGNMVEIKPFETIQEPSPEPNAEPIEEPKKDDVGE